MIEYVCERCDYKTPFKVNYRKHLLRKTPCLPTKNDVSQDTLLHALDGKFLERPTNFTCSCCHKNYATRASLWNHHVSCKLKATIKSYKSTSIRNFGEESLQHISGDFLDQCLMKDDLEFETLIKMIYFDMNVPENHNVRLKNMEHKTEIYTDGHWVECDSSETIYKIMQNTLILLFDHFHHVCKTKVPETCSDVLIDYLIQLKERNGSYVRIKRNIYNNIRNSVSSLLVNS